MRAKKNTAAGLRFGAALLVVATFGCGSKKATDEHATNELPAPCKEYVARSRVCFAREVGDSGAVSQIVDERMRQLEASLTASANGSAVATSAACERNLAALKISCR